MYMYVYDKYMNPVHNVLAEYHIPSDLDILPEQSVVEPGGGGGNLSWDSPTREVLAKPIFLFLFLSFSLFLSLLSLSLSFSLFLSLSLSFSLFLSLSL